MDNEAVFLWVDVFFHHVFIIGHQMASFGCLKMVEIVLDLRRTNAKKTDVFALESVYKSFWLYGLIGYQYDPVRMNMTSP